MIKEGGLKINIVKPFAVGKGKDVAKEDDIRKDILSPKKSLSSDIRKEGINVLNWEASSSIGKKNFIAGFKSLSLLSSPINGNDWVSEGDIDTEDKVTEEFPTLAKEIDTTEKEIVKVVKAFGDNIMFSAICNDLRRQWRKFGKFHITGLGTGWVLCSFEVPAAIKEVLSGGPWYVRGHVVGLDKWSTHFSPNSLKGISAPIWVRLPNLPLHCWDDINICRIASIIGKPYLLDGNSFQWGTREYARICIRVPLKEKLPFGVWVEGLNGKCYQKFEYKGIAKLCCECGKMGHTISGYGDSKKEVLRRDTGSGSSDRNEILNNLETTEELKHDNEVGHLENLEVNHNHNEDIQEVNDLLKVDRIYEEVDANKIALSKMDLEMVAPAPMGNSFGILSKMEDDTLDELTSVTENKDIEEGEIRELDSLGTIPAEEILEGNLNVSDSRAIKEVDSASGKKIKLLKELKSLGSAQVVTGDLEIFNKSSWMVSTVYGSRNSVDRAILWEKLEMSNGANRPAIIEGDFNCILSQVAVVKHLSRVASDHFPIILEIFKPINSNHKDIRFEDVWASYHGATVIVEKSWKKIRGGDPTKLWT
ncbi:hypothetical protein KFK09_026422 [Dendrobium nobile]|uniref:DUF4283 domain-containing protein n=1 Tax=Dendrobium nobile TaxID=94219 RepID=A0A8T3A6H9_DENNO|nr:hypothetical protein KFK09_026422 [Dendrobium nobile]